jgi:hypothetical protein
VVSRGGKKTGKKRAHGSGGVGGEGGEEEQEPAIVISLSKRDGFLPGVINNLVKNLKVGLLGEERLVIVGDSGAVRRGEIGDIRRDWCY